MKKFLSLICIMALLSIGLQAQNKEKKAIKKSFEKYKKAILNNKGEEAVKYVDSTTIAYYGEMLDLVKNADSAKVESLSITDKLMVFSIRHRVEKKKILEYTGRTIFVHAVNSGMVGKNSVSSLALGEVSIEGNFGKAQLVINTQVAPIYYHFHKENDDWKLDLTSLFSVSTIAFESLVENSEMTENEYLFHLLEIITGENLGSDIWLPVKE